MHEDQKEEVCGLRSSHQLNKWLAQPTMKPESTAFLWQIYSIWLPHQDGRNIFHY